METRLVSPYITRVWELAWPTAVFSILEVLVGMVDIYFAGFLGADAVASIGFSRQIFLVSLIFALATTTGTITQISQNYGAQRYERASAVAFHSIVLAIVLGIFVGGLGILLAKPVLQVLGAAQEVVDHGSSYLQVLLGGMIFMMLNFATNAIYRALGDAKTPLKIAVLIVVLNVLFSYIFIFGIWIVPPLGVAGVALGTILSRAVGALIAIYILARPNRTVRLGYQSPIDFTIFHGILRIGLPNGFSGLFRNVARLLFFAILAATMAGTHAVAAATIGFQFRLFAIMPALAFQVATASLVGQSIGAQEVDEAEKYGWSSIRFSSFLLLLLSMILFLFPEKLVALFTDSADVMQYSSITLRFIALEQFCSCVSIVCSGVLSGAGDTKPIMRYTVIAQWYFMLPVAFYLAFGLGYDVYGAWVAWGIAPVVQMLLTLYRVFHGHWKTIQVTH